MVGQAVPPANRAGCDNFNFGDRLRNPEMTPGV
jgi:hypothetical protein